MRFIELLEQIELLEAAKDRYLPMFNFLQPTDEDKQTGLFVIKQDAWQAVNDAYFNWAIGALSNSDRITWYLRLVRLAALKRIIGDAERLLTSLRSKVTATEDAQEASQAEMQIQIQALERLDAQARKMLEKDVRKLEQAAQVELDKERQTVGARYKKLTDKLEKSRAFCQENPDNNRCGLELEALADKTAALGRFFNPLNDTEAISNSSARIDVEILRNLQQQLAHFESIGYQPMRDYRFGNKPASVVLGQMNALEQAWSDKQSRTIAHDEDTQPGLEKILEFGKDKAWFNLHKSYCNKEGAAMGHCGNDYGNMRSKDEIISFRTLESTENGVEHWKPHLTFVFDTSNGMMGEMKGLRNSKPTEAYHPYIVALLNQDWVKGIVKRAHQHAKSNDFYISDLPKEQALAMVEKKPELATYKDRRILGLEADMSSMELDKVNEDLEEWNIDPIEGHDGDDFILVSYEDKKSAYEALSGESWPDLSDVPDIKNFDNAYKDIYDELSDEVKNLFIDYVVVSYPDEVEDYTGYQQEENEYAPFDPHAEGFGFEDAMEIIDEEGGDNPLKEAIENAWGEYHLKGLESEAEYSFENLSEYSGYGENEWEWHEDDFGDGGLAIKMNVDYFFSEVYPELEAAGSGGWQKSWSQLLSLSMPGAVEQYSQNVDEDTDMAADIALQVEPIAKSRLEKEVGKQRANQEYQAQQLRKQQMGLGLEEPEQPEEPEHKGAEPQPKEKPHWADWMKQAGLTD